MDLLQAQARQMLVGRSRLMAHRSALIFPSSAGPAMELPPEPWTVRHFIHKNDSSKLIGKSDCQMPTLRIGGTRVQTVRRHQGRDSGLFDIR